MTRDEAEAMVAELMELTQVGGTQNAPALSRFRTLARQLLGVLEHPYAREKIEHALQYADTLFSVRKHAAFPGGADGVAGFIRNDLGNAKRNFRDDPGLVQN